MRRVSVQITIWEKASAARMIRDFHREKAICRNQISTCRQLFVSMNPVLTFLPQSKWSELFRPSDFQTNAIPSLSVFQVSAADTLLVRGVLERAIDLFKWLTDHWTEAATPRKTDGWFPSDQSFMVLRDSVPCASVWESTGDRLKYRISPY